MMPSPAAPTPANFPCGAVAARRSIRHAFRNSKDARVTIEDFQRENSLHANFARAFGTTPVHEAESAADVGEEGGGGRSGGDNGETEGERRSPAIKKRDGDDVNVEPLDPSPVLDFLSHLGVTRHEVHSRVAAALRSAIEDEVARTPVAPLTPASDAGAPPSSLSPGEAGHRALLNLLKSAWQFRDVPELRPVLVCVLKRLGERTPVPMLRRLGVRQKGDGTGAADSSGLKNAELVVQLGPHLQRLIWEADWDAKSEELSTAQKDGAGGEGDEELTLHGSTILADLLRPSVHAYTTDADLMQASDLAFVGTLSERRYATKLRRLGARDSDTGKGSAAGETLSTLALIGAAKSGSTGKKAEEELNASSSTAVSVASIKEQIGSRPKLLGAVLDMLIAEHATKGGGRDYIKVKPKGRGEGQQHDAILGGSTNLACSLMADVLLTFGQLPRSYEVIDIMARILDDVVQAGCISDNAIAQLQGCLRTIFRPPQSAQVIQSPTKDRTDGGGITPGGSHTKIKLSLKTAKPTSMFPDLPVDDSAYERKILQRILKNAITSMKENDPQGLFLNPVTDDIAPGYSNIIKRPICIREIETKMMSCDYKTMDEFRDDYNVGPAGQWFRTEAGRQKKLWKDILSKAKSNLKSELTKRKNALKRKPKPPPPLAFAPGKTEKSAKTPIKSPTKEAKDDSAINNLNAEDIKPLQAWNYKRRKTEVVVPSMQCMAAMLIADPFVVRVLTDRIQKILRVDVLKEKGVPAGHHVLPSIFQLLNIARISTQLCALKGKHIYIPDAGLRKVLTDGEDFNPSYESTRNCLPLFSNLLLDAELDKRIAVGGDLHEAALQDIVAKQELQTKEWEGTSRLYDLRTIVEGALVHLLQPGNSNEVALQSQFPRYVAALDNLSDGNMLNERPFFMSMSHALLRYKSKLPHSTRDLVTGCMLNWLKIEGSTDPDRVICSQLHECLINLLNEWSSLGNLVLPRDLFLSISEETVATASGVGVGQKCERFVKLWSSDSDSFVAVKEQYKRMLSSTPDARASQWKEKIGISESISTSPKTDKMQVDA